MRQRPFGGLVRLLGTGRALEGAVLASGGHKMARTHPHGTASPSAPTYTAANSFRGAPDMTCLTPSLGV